MSDPTPAANNFSTVASAIGICTVVPLLYALFFWWLPSARVKVLNSLLFETEDLFRTAMEDGLMTTDVVLQRLYTQLWVLKTRIDIIRLEVYNNNSLRKELVGLWTGLSAQAKSACDELTVLKKELAKRSSRERQRRGAQAFRVHLAKRLHYQQFFVHNTLGTTAPCPSSRDLIPTARGEPSRLPDQSRPSRRPHLKAQADSRRRLYVEFGRYLLDLHSAQALPRHPSMIPISPERRRRGQARSLMRSMTRYLRRKLGQHQGASSATTEDDIIDVDRALFASLQPVSDAETDWEDVAHVGRIRLVA